MTTNESNKLTVDIHGDGSIHYYIFKFKSDVEITMNFDLYRIDINELEEFLDRVKTNGDKKIKCEIENDYIKIRTKDNYTEFIFGRPTFASYIDFNIKIKNEDCVEAIEKWIEDVKKQILLH